MQLTIKVSIVLFALTIAFYKWRKNTNLTHLVTVCFAGVSLCILLWFEQYKYHDYYVISFLPFFPLLFTVFVKKFIVDIRVKWIAYGLKLLFIWFLFKNIAYAQDRQNVRYEGWMSYNIPVTKSFMTITPYMRSLGITPEDKVISIPDQTPNASLYFMNQPGWTTLYEENKSEENINYHIKLGAKYLIVSDTSLLKENYLLPFIQQPIGQYEEIKIFKLGGK